MLSNGVNGSLAEVGSQKTESAIKPQLHFPETMLAVASTSLIWLISNVWRYAFVAGLLMHFAAVVIIPEVCVIVLITLLSNAVSQRVNKRWGKALAGIFIWAIAAALILSAVVVISSSFKNTHGG